MVRLPAFLLLLAIASSCRPQSGSADGIARELRDRPVLAVAGDSSGEWVTLRADSSGLRLTETRREGNVAGLRVEGLWRSAGPSGQPVVALDGSIRAALRRGGIEVTTLAIDGDRVRVTGTACAQVRDGVWSLDRGVAPWSAAPADSGTVGWSRVRTGSAGLPALDPRSELTAELVGDLDGDGKEDFVVAGWEGPDGVRWFRRWECGWTLHAIEPATMPIEAGGVLGDVDGDGDLDVIFGGTFTSPEVWWWENPLPHGDPTKPWHRALIRTTGLNLLHDQLLADIDGDGRSELISWNQRAHALLAFSIPRDSAALRQPWPERKIFEWSGGDDIEGLAAADLDGDGRLDLFGGGRWFEPDGKGGVRAHVIDDSHRESRVAVGRFLRSGGIQVVFSPGDADSPLAWYERRDTTWVGHELLPLVRHGHSLAVGDINGDGLDDIYCAEMAHWSAVGTPLDNPDPRTWILYSRGDGSFTTQVVETGRGTHEGKLSDVNGDGRLDIVAKAFRDRAPRVDVYLNVGPPAGRLPLDRWERVVVDPDRPGKAVFVLPVDVEDDGRPEILAGRWGYWRNGAGGWERRALGGRLRNVGLAADLDRDGFLDLLGTGSDDDNLPDDSTLVWLRGTRAGRLEHGSPLPAGRGDFLQGIASLGAAAGVALSWHGADRGVQILAPPRDSAGTWSLQVVSRHSQDEQLTAVDLDGDGRLDLVTGTRALMRADSGWRLETIDSTAESPDRNRAADIDGDGRPDVVVGFEAISKPGRVRWYARGAGGWTGHDVATVTGPMSLDLGDLDGDGDVDIVVGEHDLAHPETARLLIFENLDHGRAWRETVVATGDEHHDGAQVVDIDGDGDPDIVSVGWGHHRVLLFRNLAVP